MPTFYIKDEGFTPLTLDQIDLFNRYKDQAQVWLKLAEQFPYTPRVYREEPLKHQRIDPDQTPAKFEYLTNAQGEELAEKYRNDALTMLRAHPELKLGKEDLESFANEYLLHAIKYFSPEGGMSFTTWLQNILLQQGTSLYKRFIKYQKETGGEISLAEPQPLSDTETTELEQLIKTTDHVRVENELEYSLFRQTLQKVLPERLFMLWILMSEEGLSNPQIADAFKLTPARISGLKKQMLKLIKQLPEVKELENTSSVRSLIFKAGDKVRVKSINKIGNIIQNFEDGVYDICLDYNKNTVRTIKEDIEKYTSIKEASQRVVNNYFKTTVRIPKCYISLAASPKGSQLFVLELRPVSENIVSARLYSNNNLLGLTKLSEEDFHFLFNLLESYIEEGAHLCPSFIAL